MNITSILFNQKTALNYYADIQTAEHDTIILYRRFSTLTDTHIAGFEVARVLFTQMTWRTDLFGLARMLSTATGWSSKQCGTCAFIFFTADHLH